MACSYFLVFPLILFCTLIICAKIVLRYMVIRQKNYVVIFAIYLFILFGATFSVISRFFLYNLDIVVWVVKIMLFCIVFTHFLLIYAYYSYFSKNFSLFINILSVFICSELIHLIVTKEIFWIFIISDGSDIFYVYDLDVYFKSLLFVYITLSSVLVLQFFNKLIEISSRKARPMNLIIVHGIIVLFILLFFSVYESSSLMIPFNFSVFLYLVYILLFLLLSLSLMKNQKIQLFMDRILISDVIIFDAKGIILFKHSKSKVLSSKFLQNSMMVGFSQLYSAVQTASAESRTYIKSIHIDDFLWVYHFYEKYEIGIMIVSRTDYSLIADRLDFFFKIMEKEILEKECVQLKESNNDQGEGIKVPIQSCKINSENVEELLEKIFRISVLDEFSLF